MENIESACIISVGIGKGYAAGVKRQMANLRYYGCLFDILHWYDYPEGCPKHEGDGQYNFKVYAFREAFRRGYKIVLWLDASVYNVADTMPVMDWVQENGLYFFKSGFSLAQTSTDRLLHHAGVYREDLLDVPEFATGIVGINIDNPLGKEFFTGWEHYMESGLFGGARHHSVLDSTDPRFLFSRQDQSAASMVLHKMGITKSGEETDWQAYYGQNYDPERVIFFIKGV